MFVPPADRALSDAEWRAFVASQGFGHLIAVGRDRAVATVSPGQFVLEGDVVLAHVAVGNPILTALEERPAAMWSVAGDWAFVPSHWKAIAEEDPTRGIPTTYYAAVQLAGAVEVVEDKALLADVLRRQLGALQPDVEVADPLVAHPAKLAAIRGVVLRIEDVHAKFKYGGNVDEAHRREVIERLEARGGVGDRAAARHARQRLEAATTSVDSAFRRD